jgi:uncharacterized protein YkwD
MRFTSRDIRVPALAMRGRLTLAVLATLLVAGFQASAVTAPAGATAKACKRYADKGPSHLSAKHARAAVVCLINRVRSQNGRGHLDRDGRLNNAAARHSVRMRKQSCFSHQCPGESSLLGRLRNVRYIVDGLSRWAYGENIAWGTARKGTPRRTVSAWMNSSGHRANILSGNFRDVGVGYSHKGKRGYYTADFGLRAG